MTSAWSVAVSQCRGTCRSCAVPRCTVMRDALQWVVHASLPSTLSCPQQPMAPTHSSAAPRHSRSQSSTRCARARLGACRRRWQPPRRRPSGAPQPPFTPAADATLCVANRGSPLVFMHAPRGAPEAGQPAGAHGTPRPALLTRYPGAPPVLPGPQVCLQPGPLHHHNLSDASSSRPAAAAAGCAAGWAGAPGAARPAPAQCRVRRIAAPCPRAPLQPQRQRPGFATTVCRPAAEPPGGPGKLW